MVLKAIKTKKSLRKKGFTQDESHHHYFEFWYEGKVIATTYTSHNDQDIDEYLIKAMSRQCLMEKTFFIEFIKCTKSKEDYVNLLIAKGEIGDSPTIEKTVNPRKRRK